MKKYDVLWILVGLIWLSGCISESATKEEKRDIREFYFPVDRLFEGEIYEYESVGSPYDPPFYWYYRTLKTGNDVFFTGMYYDYKYQPFQFIREEIVGNGMMLRDFYWYETDSVTNTQQQVPVKVIEPAVFPFQVGQTPGVVVSSIQWKLPEDTLTTMTFIRNRQFEKDTSIQYQGRNIPAIKVNVIELIDNEREGHLEQEYPAVEIYAKNIGLVYFEKNITPDWQMKYALKETYSMEQFLEKSKPVLEGKDNKE